MSKKNGFDDKIKSGLQGLTGKNPDPDADPAETDQVDQVKRGKGRPPADHGKKRYTIIIEPDYITKMKIIAARQNRQISEAFSEAVADYIEKNKYLL